MSATSALLDKFYFKTGPCCAGCDYWRYHNALYGECVRSPKVSAADSMASLGISSISGNLGAGHVITRRDEWCGEFKDEFDWQSLPLIYRKRIGCP